MKRPITAYDDLPMVIGVAGGLDKAPSIAGVPRGGLAGAISRVQAVSLDVLTLRRGA